MLLKARDDVWFIFVYLYYHILHKIVSNKCILNYIDIYCMYYFSYYIFFSVPETFDNIFYNMQLKQFCIIMFVHHNSMREITESQGGNKETEL